MQRHHTAFTLLEVLLAMGIIGIIASAVMVAINPNKQLTSARDSERRYYETQLQKAIMMYLIQEGSMPGDKTIQEGESNAIPICRRGTTDPGCIDLATDLVPEHITDIPIDSEETNTLHTGYATYLNVGRAIVKAQHLNE